MIKGKGEIRDSERFWKTGQGILHKEEFKECPKDCTEEAHCVNFNWRHFLSDDDVADGKIFSFTAHPKGGGCADQAKSIRQVYIGR
ncbi:MAG: hypothetical protein UW81_C0022G0010 [Candidatus Giovannonibacteria bacterium GW2011_GWC2_44_9]|uniref:Uncharacterized protein n=3 Tax=Candidatus Giovannoniibacteriota TaxID=1752738 RepID=A0A0G1IYK7_9BACT|nr:MAG: hypothetical protein UW49_C0007G0097 [Candidatus Giovannonibacteria bacterium GW2011_GWB1_44_23]KKT64100.1 MAG: hypothetical protein UW57_C0003G0094 [Candidatus Giovannonibacteria bacterium GW2011_GWA1_44_29]KKT83280.1 MAG: hypothetical protein UW81_C0022G0010 [Candidatus Giovannonibacteria bacterium GW2011_GWC2_44_9]KKT91950.1 MAG: hypothetical protein UW93_C0002G0097 [Parcubacteria group bacterium GW2011_GWC1_45_13]